MTADDDTRGSGHESTDIERQAYPLQEASEAALAAALDEQAEAVGEAAGEVCAALEGDSGPLTDEKVARLWESAGAVAALSRTLTLRVPEEHQVSERE